MELKVRELQADDIPYIVSYWCDAQPEFLLGMGVDLIKLPTRATLSAMLENVLTLPYSKKPSYATIWCANGLAIGHCNVTDINFGEEAFMHLHMWQETTRSRGLGLELLKQSIPFFFNHLKLKRLISEPYHSNEAPSRTLAKAGFRFEKSYTTIPGSLSFEQKVNRWVMLREE